MMMPGMGGMPGMAGALPAGMTIPPDAAFAGRPTELYMPGDWEQPDARTVNAWVTLYPAYFNSKRSCTQGRKVGKERCLENPNIFELTTALRKLDIPHAVQWGKRHPADFFAYGRCKVCLKRDDAPTHDSITSRRQLLHAVGDELVKLDREALRKTYTPKAPEPAAGGKGKGKRGGGDGAGGSAGGEAGPSTAAPAHRKKKKGKRNKK